MRLRAGLAAAVAVGLLAVVVPGAAHAAAPANEVFYPAGQEPKPEVKPESKPEPNPDAEPAAPANDADLAALNDRDREAAHARGSRMAVDLMGFMPSLYQGKWFMPGKEDVRRCILDRESNFNYRATSGVYHGAYQMSAALARGATWMMQPEVRREMGEEGVAIVEALRKTTPNRWNRYWQDRAFWTIWRNGDGASHWHGGC